MKMITIFFNERPIIITDHKSSYEDASFYGFTKDEIMSCLYKIRMDSKEQAVFYHSNLKLGLKKFKKPFKIIKAAGGLVKNSKNESLWIFRNGKWDLPKGKIEKGEKKKEAAIREVEEECGISELIITDKLLKTYHIYQLKGKYIFKITYWYTMYSDFNGALVPQTTEGISEVKWVGQSELAKKIDKTFANIRFLFSSSLSRL